MNRVFLIGMPGSGKSTLGRKISHRLDIPFHDLDDLIESKEGKSIVEIFSEKGEDHFRLVESQVLREVVSGNEELILACGGGTPCYHQNMEFLLDKGLTIYLQVEKEILIERVRQKQHRPLLKNNDPEIVIDNLLSERRKYYQKADLTFAAADSFETLIQKIRM